MINKKIVLKISEPWDFNSTDGENTLIVQVERYTKSNDIIVRCISCFENMSKRLLLSQRNESNNQYNIYTFDDIITDIDSKKFRECLVFVMIGKKE